MTSQKQHERLRRGRSTAAPQQINNEIRDRSPIRDESQNQDAQMNEDRAKTVTQILKEEKAKIDGQDRNMMVKIFEVLEKLEKANEEQKKIGNFEHLTLDS